MGIIRGDTVSIGTILSSSTTYDIDMGTIDGMSIQSVYTSAIPSAITFHPADVNVSTNIITKTAHGMNTGLKGQFTTVTTLPAGLSLATDYFIIKVTVDTFKVATSLANALAGTAVDITSQGTDDHTFTPNATLTATLKLSGSNDGTNFTDLGSPYSTSISATGSALYNISSDVYHGKIRIDLSVTSGALTLSSTIRAEGKV